MKVQASYEIVFPAQPLPSRDNTLQIPHATKIIIQIDDPTGPITIEELDNGEIAVIHDGECYLSVFGPTTPQPS